MIKEEVVSTELFIQKQGEQHYFQVTLPRDTSRIIGLEVGNFRGADTYFLPPSSLGGTTEPTFIYRRMPVAGELTLAALNPASVFYKDDIILEDYNPFFGQPFAFLFPENSFTHPPKREQMDLNISGDPPVIEGIYKDKWAGADGANAGAPVNYSVTLYLWVEKMIS